MFMKTGMGGNRGAGKGKGSSRTGGGNRGVGRNKGTRGRAGERPTGGRMGGMARIGIMRVMFCRFCKDKTKEIEYKNLGVLEKMISERGKILSRRVSGNCAGHQRKIAREIKRARFVSLLPYAR